MLSAPLTPGNLGLAKAVNNRIHSDAVMLAARASLWRMGGVGLLLLLMGMGVGAAFYGYSYISDDKNFEKNFQKTADKMAEAFAAALKDASIGVHGDVGMTPGTVTLEPGGTVQVETVTKSSVASPKTITAKPADVLDGPYRLPAAITKPAINLPPQAEGVDSAKTVTNYTIFKQTPFGKGNVVTGWRFPSSSQDVPTNEYCYYTDGRKTETGAEIVVYLADDGKLLSSNASELPYGLDIKAAAAQCVWHNGKSTQ